MISLDTLLVIGAAPILFCPVKSKNIDLVEQAAIKTDEFLSPYILKAATDGRSYTSLKLIDEMPCSRDTFYICYHKFFWILSQLKQVV